MKTSALLASTLAAALAASASLACGEGQFNMGQGMRYQGYLAPRPATVLVYDDAGSSADAADRAKLYKGLEMAGHRVTVVEDASAFSTAVAGKRYDVVIADLSDVDQLSADAGLVASQARLLPVVDRKSRNAPDLRTRFGLVLVEGASLGQYLKVINQALVPKL